MAKKDFLSDSRPRMATSHDVKTDSDYVSWIDDLKRRYRQTQIKAAVKVNSTLLLFYWQLGRDLVVRKAEQKWGKGVVEQVSLDLQSAFPDAKGFSAVNLWRMKQWYLFYSGKEHQKLLQFVEEKNELLHEGKISQVGREIHDKGLSQSGRELEFPPLFGYVPWRHHVEIVTKCKSVDEALFYVEKTIQEGWSRSTLVNCLKADMYHAQGSAITNFSEILPETQSRLAQEIVKDTYDLSFIALPKQYSEKMLEDALEQNITRFLLELGTGFAFVGRQKEIIVAGKSRKIDLLFYHIRLRCYVVVELKTVSFEPEFAGKLNFYVNAVNELLKSTDDNPSIGLLICKDKDKTEVRWAFQGIQTPMGVASYDNVRIKEIESQLPTEEQIRNQIELAEESVRKESENKSGKEMA